MNLDWHRLRAVVLESDDWGLCGWVPDDRAHRALANQPAFRTEAAGIDGADSRVVLDDGVVSYTG